MSELNVNPLIFPTLLLACAFACAAYESIRRVTRTTLRIAYTMAAVIAALPGVSVPLYYLHLYDNSAIYYSFRALAYSELTASGVGLLVGVLAFWAGISRARARFVNSGLVILLALIIAAPYAKPVLAPIPPGTFADRWSDGVCLQSTASCGAACTATFLKRFGFDVTERQIARECFTYVSGTENWYLARALRRRGLDVSFVVNSPVGQDLPAPCIAGVQMGASGHFICILDEKDGIVTVGDPLAGQSAYTKADLFMKYRFSGFYMHIASSR